MAVAAPSAFSHSVSFVVPNRRAIHPWHEILAQDFGPIILAPVFWPRAVSEFPGPKSVARDIGPMILAPGGK